MVPPPEPPTAAPGRTDAPATLTDTTMITVGPTAGLATDIHLPPAVGDGVPTLLLRTPYGRRGDIDRVFELAEAATAAGLALVTQDVRGRHDSSGEALPFVHDAADGAVTLDWLAGQSWSNGEVVPVGDSYSGFTACAAAASGAAQAVAVVARVTNLRPYDEWLHRSGVFRLDLALPWLDFAFGSAGSELDRPDWTEPDVVHRLAAALPDALRDSCLAAGAADGEWDRTSRVDPLRIAAPILHWTGWWDCLGHGQWQDARDRLASPIGSRDGLIVGPTDHEFHTWTRPADTMEQAGLLVEYADRVRHLARAGDSLPRMATPARAARADRARVRTADTFYLRDAGRALLGPEGGMLGTRPDALVSSVAWMHDPARPVPSLDGWVWGPLREGLADETPIQVRDDVATFTSGEIRQDELLAGQVRLTVRGGSEGTDWHLVAVLTDVARDGSATRVADGVTLTRHVAGWQEVQVDLGTVTYQMRAGHRLRLSLAASAYPRYPAWPGRPDGWWHEDMPRAHEVRVQVGPRAYLEVRADSVLDALLDGLDGLHGQVAR